MKPITPHEFRHTFASMLIASGANVKAVASILGHASPAITLERYTHLFEGDEVAVGARLDAFLDSA